MSGHALICLLCLSACSPIGHLSVPPLDSSSMDTAEGDTDTDTDTDTDADSDADTDTVSYFRPDHFGVHAYIGMQGGEVGSWAYNGHTTVSYAMVILAKTEYFHGGDESTACLLYYQPSAVAVAPSGEEFLAWDVTWTGVYATDSCHDLDPGYYGSDPLDDIGVSVGSIGVSPLNDYTEQLLEQAYKTDYFDDNSVGVEMHLGELDAVLEAFWDHYPRDLQLYQGWAYEADEDMNSDFTTTLSPRELDGDINAVLAYSSLYIDTPDAGLP